MEDGVGHRGVFTPTTDTPKPLAFIFYPCPYPCPYPFPSPCPESKLSLFKIPNA